MLDRGIAKDVAALANDYRDFGGLDVEAVKQRLGTLVGVEIDVGIGIGVAAEKLANAERAGGVAGAEQNQVAEAA